LRRTRFLLLFGMYAVLLAEPTGTRDLVIGTPLSGRLHPAAEQIIGNFANSMPIRVDLSGDPSLAKVIYRAQRAVLPGTRRLQAMAPAVERAVGRPLTRVEFTVSEIPGTVLSLPNIDLSVVKIPEETSRNDLLLTTGIRGDGKAYALFKYKSALFRESTVMRWAARYDQLIRLAVSDPEVRMSRLPPAGLG
jgi:non-ribosomal peptide synthetase component F